MITKLEIENFYSIQDCQVLDLVAPGNAPVRTNHLIESFSGSGQRVPKVIAIFGANGSGKSNILRALTFIIWFLKRSFHTQSDDDLNSFPFWPYIDNEHVSRPTRLRLWFSAPESLGTNTEYPDSKHSRYLYELEISNDEKKTVTYESLFFWPSTTTRKTRIFERFGNGRVKVSKKFGLSYGEDFLSIILKPTASVISTMVQFNHEFSTEFCNQALLMKSNILVRRQNISDQDLFQNYADHNELVTQINREIKRIDFGISSLDVSSTENGKKMMRLYHDGLNLGIPFELESHGTQQFIRYFPIIAHALVNGGIAIIDELDASIHPTIMEEILRWFRDPRRNMCNAQLWISCQSPSLLEELQKDEIVLCEKDNEGKTEVFSLNDIKSVRRDDNFYRKYMGGQYGALPVIG